MSSIHDFMVKGKIAACVKCASCYVSLSFCANTKVYTHYTCFACLGLIALCETFWTLGRSMFQMNTKNVSYFRKYVHHS